ncbi:MAG: nicotinate (nicotinamide) nucleotide adenylyltransferase [Alphaproteobacteria bacterium]|nr:nicotinate (nicotinamide) nucleotide adenylyltransferase [Alphaproteobacteria bacterium]
MNAVRMGLLGGTFDPPHAAHVALARFAIDALKLQTLRVLPTGQPWHRDQIPSPAKDRVAMCQLAFRDCPQVVVDDRETRRAGSTYTIDTVEELRREWPEATWFLIIGADQARRFETWHRWRDLLCHVHIAVADRDPQAGQWQNTTLSSASVLPWTPRDISATQIRQAVALGQPTPWIDPQVLGYIQHHQLYQVPNT